MRDFTADRLHLLFNSLTTAGYRFSTVAGYLKSPAPGTVILRHDVDALPENSLRCAAMENRLGITGTYYFRVTPGSYNETIIREIFRLGHEIGYHYEDLATAHGDYSKAIRGFEHNLARLRRLVPMETICMHGSPLSVFDNRLLWEKYNYRDYGIVGEPYLDIDFQTVLYLTDTGRRWNGRKQSIRDHAGSRKEQNQGDTELSGHPRESNRYDFRSTISIIRAAEAGELPPVLMLTLHPQRWENRILPWLYELVWQNTKNAVKRILTALSR